ncbi:MAG: J domain-containing protein [Pyrinomonadaceae bacterium]
MNVLTSLSSERILSISPDAPEKLFSGDPTKAKSEYRALGRCWHPDHNPNPEAGRVFQHISALYKKALELIETDSWRGPGTLELERGSSVFRRVSYFRIVPFELGEMYVGEREVVFSVRRQYADLMENARKRIGEFRFADSRMKSEIVRCLPQDPEFFTTSERLLMLLPKRADLILLDDLRDYLGGRIAPRHVGWIQSTLHNLSCYLSYAGLVHNDIGPATFFVSPKTHSGALLGGWWYSCRAGAKLAALPQRTIQTAPADVIRSKQADIRTDLELIRATGRELLGDPTGAHLKTDKRVPEHFARWFNGATTGNAIEDYTLWREVLRKSFGPPRFIRLEAPVDAIYRRAA